MLFKLFKTTIDNCFLLDISSAYPNNDPRFLTVLHLFSQSGFVIFRYIRCVFWHLNGTLNFLSSVVSSVSDSLTLRISSSSMSLMHDFKSSCFCLSFAIKSASSAYMAFCGKVNVSSTLKKDLTLLNARSKYMLNNVPQSASLWGKPILLSKGSNYSDFINPCYVDLFLICLNSSYEPSMCPKYVGSNTILSICAL